MMHPFKNPSFSRQLTLSLCGLAIFATQFARGETVKDGDVIEIIGDSITEQKLYSVLIEDYLLMCQPAKVRVMQFGWGGEFASGLLARIGDPLAFKPTLVTTCYGMNDGKYQPINDENRESFRKNMNAVVEAFQKSGARVIVGSPGVVDSNTFKRNSVTAEKYNETLAALSDDAKAIAVNHGFEFANVHDPMLAAMAAAKKKYGETYHVAGTDGIHPRFNGHVVMAYAFLKAMGFTGDLGEITVDLPNHQATATGPHTVAKFEGNEIAITSTRYPFCFYGDDKDPNSTAGIIEFVPFMQELNRLILRVNAPAGGAYRVTWGTAAKEYSADQLRGGINLAAEFIDNPFRGAFADVQAKVVEQQNAETPLLKELLRTINRARPLLPDAAAQEDALVEAIKQRQQVFFDAAAAAVKPLTHTIRIESLQ